MKITEKKEGNKLIFTVSVRSRTRTRKIFRYRQQVLDALKENYNLKNCVFLESLSDGNITRHKTTCRYVFECPEEKQVDIPVNYVKIDIPIVEAEFPPLVDEEKPKEEKASLSSEELPIGLKKVKKKRTTKKKTEE